MGRGRDAGGSYGGRDRMSRRAGWEATIQGISGRWALSPALGELSTFELINAWDRRRPYLVETLSGSGWRAASENDFTIPRGAKPLSAAEAKATAEQMNRIDQELRRRWDKGDAEAKSWFGY